MAETYHGFIDTAHDALLIFEACNSGLLPRVQRRFSDRERQTIRSGAVYIWDEEETGMRRWTDGRTWSPSRVHGCFLIYYELEGRRHQFVSKTAATGGGSRRSRSSRPSNQNGPARHAPYEPSPPSIMQKEQGLIKKALSLCTNDKRKLHLVCYYSREDVEAGCLTSPTNDPMFKGIQVYEERYPEISYGNGRMDRYGGGRVRSSVGSKIWNSSFSDNPPVYVRSPMSSEKGSQPYRSEVYRYPSYGAYVGPVRHVNVPDVHNQHHDQHQIQLQHQQTMAPNVGEMDITSPPLSGNSHNMAELHHSSSSSSLSLGTTTKNDATLPSHSAGTQNPGYQPHMQGAPNFSSSGGYSTQHHEPQQRRYPDNMANQPIQHPGAEPHPGHSTALQPHTAEASNNGDSGNTVRSYSDVLMSAPVYKHPFSPSFLPSPPGHPPPQYQKHPQQQQQQQQDHHLHPQPPVWQHVEPPRIYSGPGYAQHHVAMRLRHSKQPDKPMWTVIRENPVSIASESRDPSSVHRASRRSLQGPEIQPPHMAANFASLTAPSSMAHVSGPQQRQTSEEDPKLLRLPSIEKLNTFSLPPTTISSSDETEHYQTAGSEKRHGPSPVIATTNGSASNMSSEDMRQLSSLRLSLHQWS
ncbi:Gluconate transport-inducing protein [Coemansia sp. RSA 1804]|nr:Gluconate transport-inducing protein [Coemansia sp. RSA 1804]